MQNETIRKQPRAQRVAFGSTLFLFISCKRFLAWVVVVNIRLTDANTGNWLFLKPNFAMNLRLTRFRHNLYNHSKKTMGWSRVN